MTLQDLLPKLHYPTRLEKLVDGWVHGVAAVLMTFAVGAALGLAIWQGGLPMASAVAVYAVCVMTMIGCSMAYNLTETPKRKALLRRFDHAAIFLMIAGSYTPFTIQLLPPNFAIGVTVAIWIAALAGAAGKVLWTKLSDQAWCLIYLAFGWLAVLVLGPVVPTLPPLAIGLLVVAGLTYSGGVLLYLNHAIPFRRALWHACVILGAAGHYGAVFIGLVM
jgi:hemolysin III